MTQGLIASNLPTTRGDMPECYIKDRDRFHVVEALVFNSLKNPEFLSLAQHLIETSEDVLQYQ